jgi:hypothetical protein
MKFGCRKHPKRKEFSNNSKPVYFHNLEIFCQKIYDIFHFSINL